MVAAENSVLNDLRQTYPCLRRDEMRMVWVSLFRVGIFANDYGHTLLSSLSVVWHTKQLEQGWICCRLRRPQKTLL